MNIDNAIVCPMSIPSGNRAICDPRCAWFIKNDSGTNECAVAVIAKKKTIVPVSHA